MDLFCHILSTRNCPVLEFCISFYFLCVIRCTCVTIFRDKNIDNFVEYRLSIAKNVTIWCVACVTTFKERFSCIGVYFICFASLLLTPKKENISINSNRVFFLNIGLTKRFYWVFKISVFVSTKHNKYESNIFVHSVGNNLILCMYDFCSVLLLKNAHRIYHNDVGRFS